MSPPGDKYWWIRVWLAPRVRETELSQSVPTPTTQELALVVVREALCAPLAPLPVPVAPTGAAAWVPVKAMTVMEDCTLCERVAVTETPLSFAVANAFQISAVPFCALVRCTNVQVRPPPETLLTVVVPDMLSAEIKASNSSLVPAVVKAGETTVVLAVP